MLSPRKSACSALVPLSLVTLVTLACTPGPHDGGGDGQERQVQRKHDDILGPPRGRVLLLGTYEFPPGTDSGEIEVVVDKLVEFAPTKVLVGVPAAEQATLDEHYETYLRRQRKPALDALDRIALAVAKAMDQSRVWAVDAPAIAVETPDVAAWADEHGQSDRLTGDAVGRYDRWYARERRWQATEPVEDNLVWLNDPRRIAEAHGRKLVGEFEVGEDGEYPGVDALTGWVNRNLRIFANLQRIARRDGERVLVVIDAAHVSLLRHSIDASPNFDLVEVNEYLGEPQGAERQVVPLL